MSEYIDRTELIGRIEAGFCKDCNHYNFAKCRACIVDDVLAYINDAQTADVAPVRHGKWIWHKEDWEYECNVCRVRFDYDDTYVLFDGGFELANYCPYCGAEMDGGTDNG